MVGNIILPTVLCITDAGSEVLYRCIKILECPLTHTEGIPEKVIYRKHILRNIGIVLSSFTAQKFMEMFTDYLVIDYLFGLMGLGLVLKNSFVREIIPNVGVSITFNFYLFFATTIIIATISFGVSLFLEFLKGVIDPRVS